MIADERLRQAILEIVQRIVEGYEPSKVILFGSYAYGEPDEDSDVDLLIIKDTEKRPIERWLEVKRLVRDHIQVVSVSPLVYTEKEIEDRLSMRDFFVEEILERGELLYG
ncbi:MAG TPA: nucleotidyltransferase domain-containing protein [bacterium]|nr:nucleotidyltransferase domain-containing protein [bacterium]